ncbi:hypothetical protein C0992_005464 [Termitomyces sp. T32_za158]|nr:hypothetical protein C0992_005464 [Termitomyces sp. T32_za158]
MPSSHRAPPSRRVQDIDEEEERALRSSLNNISQSKNNSEISQRGARAQSSEYWDSFLAALTAGINTGTRKGKRLNGPLQPHYRSGMVIPRLVDPFLQLDAVFIHGLVHKGILHSSCTNLNGQDATDNDNEINDDNGPKDNKTLHLEAFARIIQMTPHLESTLETLCSTLEGEDYYQSPIRDLAEVFIKAATTARAGDTHKITRDVLWLLQNPTMKYLIPSVTYPLPMEKTSRGFNHNDTGLLLCPARYKNQYNADFLLSLRDGSIEACQHMLYGSGIERAEKHATKQPIAMIYNISSITPAMIAYTACQLRHALSSTTQWGMQDALFSLEDFYYNVRNLFYPPEDPWVRETLDFWNKIFYGANGMIRLKRKAPPPPPAPESDIACLKRARVEEHRRAKGNCDEELRHIEENQHLEVGPKETQSKSKPRLKHQRNTHESQGKSHESEFDQRNTRESQGKSHESEFDQRNTRESQGKPRESGLDQRNTRESQGKPRESELDKCRRQTEDRQPKKPLKNVRKEGLSRARCRQSARQQALQVPTPESEEETYVGRFNIKGACNGGGQGYGEGYGDGESDSSGDPDSSSDEDQLNGDG